VKIIDVATGKVVTEVANAHSDTVYGVAFSPDGRTLATAAADKFVKTFAVPLRQVRAVLRGHAGHALDVAWSADGKLLASAGADGAVKLWDFASGESVRTLGGPGKAGGAAGLRRRPIAGGRRRMVRSAPGTRARPARRWPRRLPARFGRESRRRLGGNRRRVGRGPGLRRPRR